MEDYYNKIAIVTGGASGIGQALVEELGKQGAKVIVADIKLETTTSEGKVQTVQVDVSRAEQVQSLVDRVVSDYGRLDYIFNNAGISIWGEVRDMTVAHWNQIMDVNFKGAMHGVMAAYPVMLKQGFGHIVNTASLAGLVPSPTITAYSTAKHAIIGLSTGLRLEAEEFGVKVSVFCPGFVNTNIFNSGIYLNSTREDVLSIIPVKAIEPGKAVQQLLKGVSRNQAVITTPFYTKLFWWVHRLNQKLSDVPNRKTLTDFRKIRKETAQVSQEEPVKFEGMVDHELPARTRNKS